MRLLFAIVGLLPLLLLRCAATPFAEPWIVYSAHSSPPLAARDAVRYLRLLRCGWDASCSSSVLLAPAGELPEAGGWRGRAVLVAPLADVPAEVLAALPHLPAAAAGGDAHAFATAALVGGAEVTLCTGAGPSGTLYSVYALLRSLGARFYIAGDVLPPPAPALALPRAGAPPAVAVPIFARRGLLPFADFSVGVDFWSADEYRAVGTQMVKAGMNFWGFHTYPFLSAGPEPSVWVGTVGDFDAASGNVTLAGAYVSSWYLTQHFPRGNLPGEVSRPTSSYAAGAAALFDRNCYGSPAQAAECWPTTPAASAAVLNNAAALLESAFSWAARMGVATCLGIEVPLVPPPGSNASLAELYTGIFARAAAATPSVACMWLWTTEAVEDHGNGRGLPQSNPLWARLAAEIGVALAARDAAAPAMAVGVNGWTLGPGDNASYFDRVIDDARFSLSAIDGCLGWCAVDPAYANVTRHAATVIPWMEDDEGLAGAELWVNRTLDHASHAAGYAASGLLGLLWRTWETEPQLAALAAAGWSTPDGQPLTDAAVYADWCAANFGADTAATCASLFLGLDGAAGGGGGTFSPAAALLPRGGQGCCGGPLSPQGEAGPLRFLNTSAVEAWAASVTGAAAGERARRWAGLLVYHASMTTVCEAGQALQAAMPRVVDEASAREFGFPALAALSWAWTAMLTALLEVTTTAGELGMLAAHEGSNGPSNFFSIAAPLRPYMAACPPYDAPAAACFADNYTRTGRALPYTVTLSNAGCSREWCAQACVDAGYALAGVEFGVACFCGDAMPPPADALPVAACAAMACAGAPAERCGDADVISIFPAACPAAPDLPPGLLPARGYAGARRAWQMPVRTTVAAAEGGLDVRVAVLAPAPPAAVALTWWLVPGPAANETLPLTLVAAGRGLWHARVPLPADDSKVLVYVVDVAFDDGGRLAVPVEGAQTVVVL